MEKTLRGSSFNYTQIARASFLLLRDFQNSQAVLPLVSRKGYYSLNHFEDNKQKIQQKENISRLNVSWSQLASLVMTSGPLRELKLLRIVEQKHKIRLRIKIQHINEQLLISVWPEETVGMVSKRILQNFFDTSLGLSEYLLKPEDILVKVKRIQAHGKELQNSQIIGRIVGLNDWLDVEFENINLTNKQLTQQQKFAALIFEEYFEKNKSMDVETNQNNQICSAINTFEDEEDELNQPHKKFKKDDQSDDSDISHEDSKQEIRIPCKVMLMLDCVQVDVFRDDGNVTRLQLSQDQSFDDLKWLIENYVEINSTNNRLICQVYAASEIFEFDDASFDYELFNKNTSPLTFFNRLKGG